MAKKIVSLKNEEFKEVYQSGHSKANRYLIMYVKTENGQGKIGISVSKKVGNSVIRHRIKRLIKEAYRLNHDKVTQNTDIIVIARNTAKDRTFAEIESALLHLLRLHKIML